MLKGTTSALALTALLGSPATALAQKYMIVAVCHTENKVTEIDPVTGRTLNTFIVPGEWTGEALGSSHV